MGAGWGAVWGWLRAILAVTALIGVVMMAIAAIAGWLMRDIQFKARLAADRGTVAALESAAARYYATHGSYPENPATLVEGPLFLQCPGFAASYDPATGKLAVTSSNTTADCPQPTSSREAGAPCPTLATRPDAGGGLTFFYAETPDCPERRAEQRRVAARHVRRGWDLYQASKLAEALAEYDTALQIDPESADAYFYRGVTLIKQGAEDRALADLEKSIELRPTRVEAYENLDWLLARRRDWDRITEYWSRLIALEPRNGKAYLERGGAYFHKGDLARALADAQEACRLGQAEGCRMYEKYKPQAQ